MSRTAPRSRLKAFGQMLACWAFGLAMSAEALFSLKRAVLEGEIAVGYSRVPPLDAHGEPVGFWGQVLLRGVILLAAVAGASAQAVGRKRNESVWRRLVVVAVVCGLLALVLIVSLELADAYARGAIAGRRGRLVSAEDSPSAFALQVAGRWIWLLAAVAVAGFFALHLPASRRRWDQASRSLERRTQLDTAVRRPLKDL